SASSSDPATWRHRAPSRLAGGGRFCVSGKAGAPDRENPSLAVATKERPAMTILTLVTEAASLVPVIPAEIDINPNDSGLPGIDQLRTIVGAIMTVGLILSVLALIVSAIVWGFGSNSSNPHLSG